MLHRARDDVSAASPVLLIAVWAQKHSHTYTYIHTHPYPMRVIPAAACSPAHIREPVCGREVARQAQAFFLSWGRARRLVHSLTSLLCACLVNETSCDVIWHAGPGGGGRVSKNSVADQYQKRGQPTVSSLHMCCVSRSHPFTERVITVLVDLCVPV